MALRAKHRGGNGNNVHSLIINAAISPILQDVAVQIISVFKATHGLLRRKNRLWLLWGGNVSRVEQEDAIAPALVIETGMTDKYGEKVITRPWR